MSEAVRPNDKQRQASDPRLSTWVNANAGSGKTHVLVDRVIRQILAGTPPSRILCLTFTKAAAAEMAGRIFKRLAGWIGLDDGELILELQNLGSTEVDGELILKSRQLFAVAQETPGGLKIQTIHAFCERLLQLFPVEAGMAPGFAVLDDTTAAEIRDACRDAVITEAVLSPESELGVALATVTAAVSQDAFDGILGHMLSTAATWFTPQDPQMGIDAVVAAVSRHLGLTGEELTGGIGEALRVDLDRYRKLRELLQAGKTADTKALDRLLPMFEMANPDIRATEDFLLTEKGEARSTKTFPTGDIQKANPWTVEFIKAEQARLIAALEKLGDISRISGTRALLLVAAAILKRYEHSKRQRGQYDFGDLIDRTNALLAEKPDAAWVLYKLDGGIDHVLIDEAQDTSPAQWDIIRSLTGEFFAGSGARPGLDRTIFAVGDRKQSIFSFQGADPAAFEQARSHFAGQIAGSGGQLRDVDFTVSFRTTPEVLGVVDKVFGPDGPARAGLEFAAASEITHQSNREKEQGLVELWPLVEPDEKSEPEPWSAPVDIVPANAPPRKLARRIAETIGDWLGGRRIGNSQRVVTPGDILILVRRRNELFDAVISELRRKAIPVAGADRLKLQESIAVLDLLALASFAVMPEDDYSLACLLKSPLVSTPITESELFALSHGRERKSLWQMLRTSHLPSHQAIAGEADRWLADAATMPPFEFFASVVQARRQAIMSRLGTEANDPLNAFLQSALDHGSNHAPSLASFLVWFKSTDIEIKRNMDQARGEVRVMTVHGAKGLEAPIVILPDTAAVPEPRGQARDQLLEVPLGNGQRSVPLWAMPKVRDSGKVKELKEHSQHAGLEEFHRLLYVAMTRARDELHVCGYKGLREPPAGNWHGLIRSQLEKMPGTRHLPDGTLRYGADPAWSETPAPKEKPEVAMPQWLAHPVIAPPPARSSTITTLAKDETDSGPADQDAMDRGKAIHRLLQLLPDVPEEERSALARHIVKRSGQPESVALMVLDLLGHEALAPLLRGDALPEVALTATLPNSTTTINGRIDRLVVEDRGITIVDYKTDRRWPQDLRSVPASYGRQMALYREVMRSAYPGRSVNCVLVWTAAPAVMALPSSFLDQALSRLMAART